MSFVSGRKTSFHSCAWPSCVVDLDLRFVHLAGSRFYDKNGIAFSEHLRFSRLILARCFCFSFSALVFAQGVARSILPFFVRFLWASWNWNQLHICKQGLGVMPFCCVLGIQLYIYLSST